MLHLIVWIMDELGIDCCGMERNSGCCCIPPMVHIRQAEICENWSKNRYSSDGALGRRAVVTGAMPVFSSHLPSKLHNGGLAIPFTYDQQL
jgi:hypothetical protein